jgi:signal transduction histidine kinase
VSRVTRFLATYGADLLIVAAAAQAAVSTAVRYDLPEASGARLVLEVAAVAAVVLVLLGRHRWPFGAPAALWILSAVVSFTDGELITSQPAVYLAGMAAALMLGNLRGERQARVGLAIVAGSAATLVYNDPTHDAGDLVFVPLIFGVVWLVGYALRERAERTEAAEERALRAERDREAAARVAVAEERTRIARELHDVVAHAMSVMVLQVGAVRHKLPEAYADEQEALGNVELAGRTALAEMRRLLDAMRYDGDELELAPHPGLDQLGSLVEEVRASGLDVRLWIGGDPFPLPAGLDLSAYRILQEGLTNVLKHAHAGRAEVEVRYAQDEVRLAVRDDGVGAPPTADGLGHGLVGVAERVKLYGGEMTAGRAADGGFVLRARLPVNGRPS